MSFLSYEREAIIKRPPLAVFDFCSDLRNELVWNPDADDLFAGDGHQVGATGTVEEHADGTLYRVRLELRPSGLSWLLAPLAVRMERQESRNMDRIGAAFAPADSA